MIWTWKGIKALFTRGKHKRTYPARGKEMCACGRMIVKCKNGKFVRHQCGTPELDWTNN